MSNFAALDRCAETAEGGKLYLNGGLADIKEIDIGG
jgi:hypothetical protein